VSRAPQELELDGVAVTSIPLGWEAAEDLLPDVARIVAVIMDRASDVLEKMGGIDSLKSLRKADVMKFVPVIGPLLSGLADQLGGGTLKRIAPLVLAGTRVVYDDAEGKKIAGELMKKADRIEFFNAHPEAYFPILFFAGKVTYARFFRGSVQSESQPEG
jgi:hypothetical protein